MWKFAQLSECDTFLDNRKLARVPGLTYRLQQTKLRDDDPIASDLFNIHENDPEMKPDVYVSKPPRVEGFP